MDRKKLTAAAAACVAEETGEEITKLRILSFGKASEGEEAPYDDRQLTYMKYHLGRRENMSKYRIHMDGEIFEIEVEKLEVAERVDPLPEPVKEEEKAEEKAEDKEEAPAEKEAKDEQ